MTHLLPQLRTYVVYVHVESSGGDYVFLPGDRLLSVLIAADHAQRRRGEAQALCTTRTSVFDPTTMLGVTPSMQSGLPAFPMPTIIPFLTPISA